MAEKLVSNEQWYEMMNKIVEGREDSIAACKGCNRMIDLEEEDWLSEYKINGGYCEECDKEIDADDRGMNWGDDYEEECFNREAGYIE
jgi:hypothetical protein